MNVFDKQYKTYKFVMSLLGLWPYDQSIYRTIQRILFSSILAYGVIIQIVSVLKLEITLENRILRLSTCCPAVLYLLRYLYFIMNFPMIKFICEQIQTEVDSLQDARELRILMYHIQNSAHVIYIFLWICSAAIAFSTTVVLGPITLDLIAPLNVTRKRYIIYITGSLVQDTFYIDITAILVLFVIIIGSLSVACTESMLNIMAQYYLALFTITSYRIKRAITNATQLNIYKKKLNSDYSDFRKAIDVHIRCISYIDFTVMNTMIPYLMASLLVVVSFALCLHRLFNAVTAINDSAEILLSVLLVVVHSVFMFLNNYSGQLVLDGSTHVFQQAYDTTWYYTPLKAQKLLLFIMLRSSVDCAFNLSGVFIPCYRGFSAMASTSFSYFTLMYSTH